MIGGLDELLGGIEHIVIITDEVYRKLKLRLSTMLFSGTISCNMIELPYLDKDGQTKTVEACPLWDMGTPEKNPIHERIRRLRGVGFVALTKEHIDWIFEDLICNYESARCCLEKGYLPEVQGYVKHEPIPSLLLSYIMTPGDQRDESYEPRKDFMLYRIWMAYQLQKAADTEGLQKKGLGYWDHWATKEFGATAMEILTTAHPEIVEDPALKWAIDTAILQTRTEIDDAVTARREFGYTYENDSVRRIYERVQGKVALVASAMRETMIDMHFNFGNYGGLPHGERNEEEALNNAREELFEDYIKRKYPEFPQIGITKPGPKRKSLFGTIKRIFQRSPER